MISGSIPSLNALYFCQNVSLGMDVLCYLKLVCSSNLNDYQPFKFFEFLLPSKSHVTCSRCDFFRSVLNCLKPFRAAGSHQYIVCFRNNLNL